MRVRCWCGRWVWGWFPAKGVLRCVYVVCALWAGGALAGAWGCRVVDSGAGLSVRRSGGLLCALVCPRLGWA